MESETKGVLSIMFGIFIFSNPVVSLIVLLASTLLQNALSTIPGNTLLNYILWITVISDAIFLALAIYYGVAAVREKNRNKTGKKLGITGLMITALALIYFIWFTWSFLKLNGII